jgi:glucan phosphoethanolaminetransferase (alkaline phosphatase superfamily)
MVPDTPSSPKTNEQQLGELFYFLGLTMIKISILCFFYRIFPVRRLQQVILVVGSISAAYGVAFFFATLFQCHPIHYMWEQWHRETPGQCNNFHMQGFIAAGISILIDIVIMILPLRQLYQLDLSLQKRLSIILMFLVGGYDMSSPFTRLR